MLPDAVTDVHAIRPGGESCDGRTKVEAAAIKSTGAKRRAKRPRSAREREAAGGASNGGVAAADREYVNLISSSDDES